MSDSKARGMFASVAKKKSGEKAPAKSVVSPEDYEDGDKPFSGSSKNRDAVSATGSSSPSAPAMKVSRSADREAGSGTQKDSRFDVVPAESVRTWKFKDRTLGELQDDPEYATLVQSIRAKGVIEPLVVRKLPPGNATGHLYEEVAGFKRLTAAKSLGVQVPVVIHELTDQEALAIQQEENKGRSAPSAWSRALHYKSLLESGVYESQNQLADSLDLNKSTLSNLLRVAGGLPKDVTDSLKLHLFGMTSLVYMLTRINNAPDRQREEFVDRLVEHADEFNDRPEKAASIVDKAWASLFSREPDTKKKPVVYQSQKGKTLSIKSSADALSVTLHPAALEVATEDELTKLVTDYLSEKGLSLEEKKKGR